MSIKPSKTIQAFRKEVSELLQGSYADLYDENCGSETPDLLQLLDQLILKYFNCDNQADFNKYFFCGLALYLSVLPSLKSSLSPEQYQSFFEIQKHIAKEPIQAKAPLDIPQCQNCPGVVSESVIVVQDFVRLLNGNNIHQSLMEMVDGCIIGAGIAHGATDKRTIFTWFINSVLIPAEEKKHD